jgi:hypothetical protein
MGFKKNTAVTGLTFCLVNKGDGSAVTSGTVSGLVTKDGGGQVSLANSPVHKGGGQWSVNLSAAEMNGEIIGLLFTHTDAVLVQFTIKTEPAYVEKAAKVLVNKAVQDKVTGQIRYYDDDGQAVILTHTPSEGEEQLVRESS